MTPIKMYTIRRLHRYLQLLLDICKVFMISLMISVEILGKVLEITAKVRIKKT